MFLIYLWIFIIYVHKEVVSSCTLPTQFQNSVWVDSDKGEIMFDTVNMTGWDFYARNNQMYENWECFHTSIVGEKLYLIMVNKEIVNIFQNEFKPYLCMELTEITPVSYYYYLGWPEEDKYYFERISSTLSITVVADPVQELCLDLDNPDHVRFYPETGEYHLLIKKGEELTAKQECPSTFFGEYSYSVTDEASGTSYCGTGNEVWDVCTDYEQMTFNYTICDTQISYSGNGSVFCVFSMTSGSYTYHSMYNEDNTVDVSSGTYRFTCMMSTIFSGGGLNVSQSPGSCRKSQTPHDQPVFANNASAAGLNLQLTPRRLCPKTNDSSSGLSAGAIVGIVLGLLVLIIAIIIVCVCCRETISSCLCNRLKCRKEKNNEKIDRPEETSSKCNKLSVDIDEIPHQRSPHWIHGPHGTAPLETKFSGSHIISKSPTLDPNYNPFSVFQIGKRKESTDKIPNGHSRELETDKENNKSSIKPKTTCETKEEKVADIPEKKMSLPLTKSFQTGKLVIEDLEKPQDNVIIPAKPDAANTKIESEPTPDSLHPHETISRTSNVAPKSIILASKASPNKSPVTQDTANLSPENRTKEHRTRVTNMMESESNADKEVSNYNQARDTSLTPILISGNNTNTKPSKRMEETKSKSIPATINSLPDNPNIIMTHFKREDLKYVGTFKHIPKTPTWGPNDESSTKEKKEDKVITKSQTRVPKKEKSKKTKKTKQSSIVKSKPTIKGHQAFNSLIRSKTKRTSQNKEGTFYNEDIPTVTETETYLHISELNDTDTGICYDDDNVKARALGHWNNESLLSNVSNSTASNHNHSKPNEMKLLLDTVHDRSISRLTHSTDQSVRGSVSTRSLSAITSRLDSRGAKYFIENESSSIAIHVKASDVPDDLGVTDFIDGRSVDNNEEIGDSDDEENEDEDEGEDEEEDREDFDESKELKNDSVETSMSVLYGAPDEEEGDEDPDRMVLKGYESDLLTIKE